MRGVALRKESVDRNTYASGGTFEKTVALRKESVDRNVRQFVGVIKFSHVALRKESVDRNGLICAALLAGYRSLSARRAWIEIAAVPAAAPIVPGRSPQGERG